MQQSVRGKFPHIQQPHTGMLAKSNERHNPGCCGESGNGYGIPLLAAQPPPSEYAHAKHDWTLIIKFDNDSYTTLDLVRVHRLSNCVQLVSVTLRVHAAPLPCMGISLSRCRMPPIRLNSCFRLIQLWMYPHSIEQCHASCFITSHQS